MEPTVNLDEIGDLGAERSGTKLSRRQALRILLGAVGGVAAANALPPRWSKPEVGVGAIPARAQQLSPTDEPPVTEYELVCASSPGSGEISFAQDLCLDTVAARLSLVSGSGPISGVHVTVTSSTPAVGFDPSLPQSVVTDATGLADFGTICLMQPQHGQEFDLLFSCVDPVNGTLVEGACGTYTVSLPN